MVYVSRGHWDVNIELLIEKCNNGIVELIILNGRYIVCGQGIIKCKCRIVNCKYVTVEFRMV